MNTPLVFGIGLMALLGIGSLFLADIAWLKEAKHKAQPTVTREGNMVDYHAWMLAHYVATAIILMIWGAALCVKK